MREKERSRDEDEDGGRRRVFERAVKLAKDYKEQEASRTSRRRSIFITALRRKTRVILSTNCSRSFNAFDNEVAQDARAIASLCAGNAK